MVQQGRYAPNRQSPVGFLHRYARLARNLPRRRHDHHSRAVRHSADHARRIPPSCGAGHPLAHSLPPVPQDDARRLHRTGQRVHRAHLDFPQPAFSRRRPPRQHHGQHRARHPAERAADRPRREPSDAQARADLPQGAHARLQLGLLRRPAARQHRNTQALPHRQRGLDSRPRTQHGRRLPPYTPPVLPQLSLRQRGRGARMQALPREPDARAARPRALHLPLPQYAERRRA